MRDGRRRYTLPTAMGRSPPLFFLSAHSEALKRAFLPLPETRPANIRFVSAVRDCRRRRPHSADSLEMSWRRCSGLMLSRPADDPGGIEFMSASTSITVTVSGATSKGYGGGGSCSSSRAAGCFSNSAAITSSSGSATALSEVNSLSAARMSPSAHFPRTRRPRTSLAVS